MGIKQINIFHLVNYRRSRAVTTQYQSYSKTKIFKNLT